MGRSVRRRLIGSSLAALLLALTACAKNAPQDTLQPEGPVARSQDNLFRPVFWIAAVIFFLVEGLIVFAAVRFRDRAGRSDPKQIHGNSRLEFAWTIVPALIMLGVAIPTVRSIFVDAPKTKPDQVRVRVTGHQWWWEYEYLGTSPVVVTANELVIPTGRSVLLELESADVIHSFWVPKLAGKQDVVPERTNTLELIAEQPGKTYLGQCAEFCSISHANMRLRVITKTPSDFDQWVREQQRPAEAASGDAARGRELFMTNACVQCHAIKGTDASGTLGPNLTHFAGRATFAAAVFDTNAENLFRWVRHARQEKAGVLMPDFDRQPPEGDPGKVPGFRILSDDEIRLIVAYLLSLI